MSWFILNQAITDNDMDNLRLIVEENAGILEQRCPNSMDNALHLATRYGNMNLVAEILKQCPFMVAAENKKGETPIHEACRRGHDKILMMLMETDPFVASKLNCLNQSALYLACCYGHFKAANIFLNQPWLQDLNDATFLHVAASQGHIAIVRKILQTYPNSTLNQDKNGYSPLHHSCRKGHPEITAMLLKKQVAQAFQFNRNGFAPVHLAAIHGSIKVLEEIFSTAPTSFELLSRKGETVFHLTVKFDNFDAFLYLARVFEKTSLFYQPDKNGDTCLHLAVTRGHQNIVEYIIKETEGEQINWRNFEGHTAMDLLEQAENTSSAQNLIDVLAQITAMKAVAGATNSKLTLDTENAVSPNTQPQPLILEEEPSDVDINLDLELNNTPLENTSELFLSSKLTSPSANKRDVVINEGYLNEFIHTNRKKGSNSRIRRYKNQSEKSKKNLIKMYQKQQKKHELYREALHNARETMTLIAVLIATITYSSGINPPGGVYQDGPLRGTAVAARRTAFKVFSISNNIALFASLCIVIVFVSIIPFRRKPLMMMLMLAHKVMWVAVGFMATAYIAATLVLMPPKHGRRIEWTVVSLLYICAGTLGSVFVALGFMLIRHRLKKLRYSSQHGQIVKHDDQDEAADKSSFGNSGHSINSDMNLSNIMGYHTY